MPNAIWVTAGVLPAVRPDLNMRSEGTTTHPPFTCIFLNRNAMDKVTTSVFTYREGELWRHLVGHNNSLFPLTDKPGRTTTMGCDLETCATPLQ